MFTIYNTSLLSCLLLLVTLFLLNVLIDVGKVESAKHYLHCRKVLR